MRPKHVITIPKGPRLCVADLDTADACHDSYDVVISILDPETLLDWTQSRHHVFWVEDLESPGAAAPDAGFVDSLLGVDLAGAKEILIHCHGGYSRSPAAAMLLARKLGATLKEIEQGIDWNQADPNRLILALGEARLGSGLALQNLAARKTGRRKA